jgi:hypothetical protein
MGAVGAGRPPLSSFYMEVWFPMTASRQELVRASARIREQLVSSASGNIAVSLPYYDWQDCMTVAELLQRICGRGWQVAARDVQDRLATRIHRLQSALQQIVCELKASPAPFVASQREIFEDLIALETEFNALDVDLKEKQISVITSPITLEDVYLGSFQIILNWSYLGGPRPYRVVPTDTDSGAQSRSETPHPHVDGDSLCEGEAKFPIRQALKQGRLFDFFTIVRQTLQTYNSDSAYVQLSDWNGTRCSDCDYVVEEEDRYGCGRCGTSICSECCRRCNGCDCYLCAQCVENCSDCNESYCKGCLSPCRKCDTHFCQECLTDDQCNDCQPEDDSEQPALETSQAGSQSEAFSTTGTAVHPHGVCQAAVPARRRRH